MPTKLICFFRGISHVALVFGILCVSQSKADQLHLNPNLLETEVSGEVFIPFIYNFRTDEIHWTLGYGAKAADGSIHPLAATAREGIN